MDEPDRHFSDWLRALDLGAYAETFSAHHINLNSIHLLNEQDLIELGLPLGPRKVLLRAIGQLAHTRASAGSSSRENAGAAGERRQLTVMFCDLVGATQLSSQLDPEDLREILRAYQQSCADIARRHEGFIAQYLGDGILVYFGYPLAMESAAERAVAAGLEITEAVAALGVSKGRPLQARVGMATGLAIVGDLIGEGASEQAAVTGQVPNLAARIQSLATPGCVAIAHSTRLLLGELFSLADLGMHDLKGIPEPVHVWRVVGKAASVSRYDSLRALPNLAIVGRAAERSRLAAFWQATCGGKGQVVYIVGDPGIGKSTLLHDLGERVTAEGSVRISMQCSDLHAATPLYPLITHLHRAADLKPFDTDEQKLAKIEAIASPEARAEEVPLLADLLSVPLSGKYRAPTLPPQQRKAMMLRLIAAQVTGLAKMLPVLVTVEDVHWMDPTTGDLAKALFAQIADARVMVLITARPEFATHWSPPPQAQRITLDKLEDDDALNLIRLTAGQVPLAHDIERMILERSDGVPLFVEELTKAVVENAAMTSASGSSAIPLTLRDILAARFDRIGGAKQLAQVGAAIGRRFSLAMLRAVTRQTADGLQTDLETLVKAGLITGRMADGDLEFRFRHSLIWETAYEGMLRARSKALHAAIADTIEQRFAERAISDPVTLAHHWERAENYAKAVGYLIEAAKRALAQYANPEAIFHTRHAIPLLQKIAQEDSPAAFELHLVLAQASYVVEGPAADATVRAYNKAQDLSHHVANLDQRVALLYGIFSSYHFAARFDLAQGPAQRVMELAEKEGSAWFRCQAHRMLGYVGFFTGDCASADAHFRALADNYQPQSFGPLAPRFGADCLVGSQGFHALVLYLRGETEAAVEMSQAALDYALRLGHPATTGWAYASACYLAYFRADKVRGRDIARAGSRYCREHNIRAWGIHCSAFEAWASCSAPTGHEQVEEMRLLIAEAAKGTLLGTPMLRGVLVDSLISLKRYDEALAESEAALKEIIHSRQLFFEPELLRLRAVGRAKSGADAETVYSAYHAAAEAAQQLKMTFIENKVREALAQLTEG